MDTNQLIKEALYAYRKSDVKLNLPYRQRESIPGFVRASSLGYCPAKAAFEKYGVPMDYPELSLEENPRSGWIADHGSYVAPMIQEALMWYAMQHIGFSFEPEVPLRNGLYKIAGIADGVYQWGALEKRIIEIKDREGFEKRSIGLPKYQDCLQLMAYMSMSGVNYGTIVVVSKWGWHCYNLIPTGSDTFTLFDGTEPYRVAVWEKQDWTTALSFDVLRQEIETLHKWAEIAKDLSVNSPPIVAPITDPINHPEGYQCAWHAEKPTKNHDGVLRPNCPFAKRCHGWENKDYATQKGGAGYVIVEETPAF